MSYWWLYKGTFYSQPLRKLVTVKDGKVNGEEFNFKWKMHLDLYGQKIEQDHDLISLAAMTRTTRRKIV